MLLDARFPAVIPVKAAQVLKEGVAFTEEVPIAVRWELADYDVAVPDSAPVLVSTDIRHEWVQERLAEGAELLSAPTLAQQSNGDSQQVTLSAVSELSVLRPDFLDFEEPEYLAPGSLAADSSIAAVKAKINKDNKENKEEEKETKVSRPRHYKPGAQEEDALNLMEELSVAIEESNAPKQFVHRPGLPSPAALKDAHAGIAVQHIATPEHTAFAAAYSESLHGEQQEESVEDLPAESATEEIPLSVLEEVRDAIALMSRSVRRGEWEMNQTHVSLIPFLQEEVAELISAIGRWNEVVTAGDEYTSAQKMLVEQELCKELGDVLLQVLFHAELANRRGAFDIGHVAGAFISKMRSRAPYLFDAEEKVIPVEEQDRLWTAAKEEEYSALEALYESNDFPMPDTDVHASLSARENLSSASESAMVAAEKIIMQARELGLKDNDIPTAIRYPMVGLERDEIGQADRRLYQAVEGFAEELQELQEES